MILTFAQVFPEHRFWLRYASPASLQAIKTYKDKKVGLAEKAAESCQVMRHRRKLGTSRS